MLGGLSQMFAGNHGGAPISAQFGNAGIDLMSGMAGMQNMPHGQMGPVSRAPTRQAASDSSMLGGLSNGLQNMGNSLQNGFGEFVQSPFGQALGTGFGAIGDARTELSQNPLMQAIGAGFDGARDFQRYGIGGAPDYSNMSNEELEELIQMLRSRMQ